MRFEMLGDMVEVVLLDGTKIQGLVEDEDENFIKIKPSLRRPILVNKRNIAMARRMRLLQCGIWTVE